jgi:Spy/CpxP family protein refolding chaperone
VRRLASLLLVLFASEALGQQAKQDEVFKMVDAYIVSNLQEGLGLTDEQFARLVPLVKRLQTDRRTLNQKRRGMIRELRLVFESGSATETRVDEIMKELRALEVESPQQIRKDQEALDAVLTPVQQAKYRVLEADVDQRIRGIMTKLGQPQRPGARGNNNPKP